MKRKRIVPLFLAAVLGSFLLSGCGENTDSYDQAVKDLEQGSYTYALQGFEESITQGVKVTESYRGEGLVHLRLGEYEAAAENFTAALESDEKLTDKMRRDLLFYRATAYLKQETYSLAMADCQTLGENFTKDADLYFLTGAVALAMDGYDEAAMNFSAAYNQDPGYDMALRIYEEYLERGMEADGTYYLEQALVNEAKTTEDICSRGRVYYFMEDFEQAREELTIAQKQGSTEALLLLGMVYLAQNDTANARAMYQQFNSSDTSSAKGYNGLALCDMADGNYDSALIDIANGIPLSSTEEMRSLLFNEIVCYEKKLDFATALQKAKEYCNMFPDDEDAARELRFLKTRQVSETVVETEDESSSQETETGEY